MDKCMYKIQFSNTPILPYKKKKTAASCRERLVKDMTATEKYDLSERSQRAMKRCCTANKANLRGGVCSGKSTVPAPYMLRVMMLS